MSTMKSAIISDLDDNIVDTNTVINGVAKAYCNYSSTDATVRKSLNVSSTVDVATGRTTLNWTNVWLDIDYVMGGCGNSNGTTGTNAYVTMLGPPLVTSYTTQFAVASSAADGNGTHTQTAFHGDLA